VYATGIEAPSANAVLVTVSPEATDGDGDWPPHPASARTPATAIARQLTTGILTRSANLRVDIGRSMEVIVCDEPYHAGFCYTALVEIRGRTVEAPAICA
jgi:hypothetical protein